MKYHPRVWFKNLFWNIGCKMLIFTVFFLSLMFFSHGTVLVQAQLDDSSEATQSSSSTMDFSVFLPPEKYYQGKIVEITSEGKKIVDGMTQHYQLLKILLLEGEEKGKVVKVKYGDPVNIREDQKVKKDEIVIVGQAGNNQNVIYSIVDRYRLTPLYLLGLLFFGLVIFFGRFRGFMSIMGLLVSILVLIFYIVPQIVQGANPFLVNLTGAFVIATSSIFLAHGFSKRTALAFISTVLTLVLATFLAVLFVEFTKLTGLGSEDTFYLQFGPLEKLNLKGLLLGGIIIGTLGVLDDVVTAQTAAVDEIQKANPLFTFKELYQRGISVGREHISSLVNTLVLAYAGVSLPLFLIFSTNQDIPLWVTFNGEFIIEEIVRTLVGSSAIIFAVPISTFLAARFLRTKTVETSDMANGSKNQETPVLTQEVKT